MTSIQTNASALSALRTLRGVDGSLNDVQSQVATALRVAKASDNAAYWSISTTMRSDNHALGSVEDALGLTAAIADTAYAGLNAVGRQLSDFMSRLVAAKEPGVDAAKVQVELDQIKEAIKSTAKSSSFNGVNWLDTDLPDVGDPETNYQSMVWTAGRTPTGEFQVQTSKVVVGALSLFNKTGGGLLQSDGHDLKSVGGIRNWGPTNWMPEKQTWDQSWQRYNSRGGSYGYLPFNFSGPVTFGNSNDRITFDVTVDSDNPADVPGPWNPGKTTSVVIDKALVDAVLPSAGGTITDARDFARVVDAALQVAGSDASTSRSAYDDVSAQAKVYFGLWTDETSGLDGSYIQISNLSSNVGSGGLSNGSDFGTRGSDMTLDFQPFEAFKDPQRPGGVSVGFDFSVDRTSKHYSFDRNYVNATLGKTDGKVDTADEMVTLLQSLLSNDYPHLIIDSPNAGQVRLKSDVNYDRLSGGKSGVGFTNIVVSNEPRATLDLDKIDIVANPSQIDTYVNYINLVSRNVTDAASRVGAFQKSISMQGDFISRLRNTVSSGIGRLIDADMNEASTRQKALQTQQQLAQQALQIANAQSSNLLTLFR